MEPHYPRGVPTAPYLYLPASDESINNPPAGFQSPFAQHLPGAGPNVPINEAIYGRPVSPPSPRPEYSREFIESNSSAQRPLHPSTPELVGQTISQQPTPPVQPEDKLAHVHEWLAQDGQRPAHGAPSGFHPLQPRPVPISSYSMPLQPRQMLPLQQIAHPQQMVHPQWAVWNRLEPAQQAPHTQYGFERLRGNSQHHSNLVGTSYTMNPFAFNSQQQAAPPASQLWPTSNLTYSRDPSVYKSSRPLPGRSPSGQGQVDKKTLRLQAEYARKGEAARLKQAERARQKQAELARDVEQTEQTDFEQTQQGQADRNQKQESPQQLGRKRKSRPIVNSLLPPTQAPALRHMPANGSPEHLRHLQNIQFFQRPQHYQRLRHHQQLQHGHRDVAATGFGQQSRQDPIFLGYQGQPSFHPVNSPPKYSRPLNPAFQFSQPPNQPFQHPESVNEPPQYQPVKATPPQATPSEPLKTDPDDLPQSITDIYEEYSWSVKLYEVTAPAVYDFAQSFLEDVFETKNLYDMDSSYKWHAHISKGFIKDGSRLSFIVLHNAANPFEWGMPPESTTSIGFYGRYGHEADKEIHWKTFAPNIRDVLQIYMDKGYFCLEATWKCDMVKATERRFHRAYWHAAKMLPLRSMLNHALKEEATHDAVDADEEMVYTDEDLQTGWEGNEIEEQQAETAWQDILNQNEENEGFKVDKEHVVTGCSEWDQFQI